MTHEAVVLTPSFGNCPYRRANEEFVTEWYAQTYGIPSVIGRDEIGRQYFSRARAINNAARLALQQHPQRDILIIADNDLIPDASPFQRALKLARRAPAITPHALTLLMSEEGTCKFLETGEPSDYKVTRTGSTSYVIMTRENFMRVNGMDELFEGWGAEDGAFLLSIERQLGYLIKMYGRRVHLWHPLDPSRADHENRQRNRDRRSAYRVSSAGAVRLLAREYGPLNLLGVPLDTETNEEEERQTWCGNTPLQSRDWPAEHP